MIVKESLIQRLGLQTTKITCLDDLKQTNKIKQLESRSCTMRLIVSRQQRFDHVINSDHSLPVMITLSDKIFQFFIF